jgi:hypothetical protein
MMIAVADEYFFMWEAYKVGLNIGMDLFLDELVFSNRGSDCCGNCGCGCCEIDCAF